MPMCATRIRFCPRRIQHQPPAGGALGQRWLPLPWLTVRWTTERLADIERDRVCRKVSLCC
jgi:hypothetical protein